MSSKTTKTQSTAAKPDPFLHAPSRTTAEILRRVLVYLLPYKGLALATILCAVLSLAFTFVFPKATMFVIDEIIAKGQGELLAPVMMMLLAAFFLSDWFNSLRIRLNNTFEQNVIYDMRRQLYAHLQRLPVQYFDHRSSGDLMTRVIEDVNSVERVLIDGTEQGTIAVLSVVGVLCYMFVIDAKLALVALTPLPLLIAGALWYTLTAHKRYRGQRVAASAMNTLLMDNLQGNRQIKTFVREGHEDRRFSRRADDLRQGSLRVMYAWAIYSPLMNFSAYLGTGLVLWYGGRLVLDGDLTAGQLMGFVLLMALLYEPIRKLHGINQLMQAARAGGERVFDILDSKVERDDGVARKPFPGRPRGKVVYDNVAFGYDSERLILNDIDIEAEPGRMIALVGPTGAGKSSLVNLLPAFYSRTGGSITIDGIDIDDLTLSSLREHIAVVTQEPFLFNGTIRENILYGRLEATEEEMEQAARSANCHEFISRLPNGYDTRVGERGVKLSVGEKQRVSIARAILKNAPILILDEATASVDTETERMIQTALQHLMEGKTSFVIAHRLSTIRNADQILVLNHGRIMERGDHRELLENGGLYARLCAIQNLHTIEEGFEQIMTATEDRF